MNSNSGFTHSWRVEKILEQEWFISDSIDMEDVCKHVKYVVKKVLKDDNFSCASWSKENPPRIQKEIMDLWKLTLGVCIFYKPIKRSYLYYFTQYQLEEL